jgi:hypothetical protein
VTDQAIIERETTALRGTEPHAWAIDPWVAMIERAARDPSIDADKMIKLYELSERASAARSKAAYAADFALMQAKLPRIDRRGRIVIYSQADRAKPGGPPVGAVPQQETPYARLEDIVDAIAPALSEHGFSISHRVERTPENMIAVTGILMHRDGHSEQTCFPLPHDSSGSKNNVQAVGSSITYGRRYTILSLLNIVSHAPQDADDDGKRAAEGETIGVDDIAHVEQQLRDTDSDKAAFLKAMKVESVEAMTVPQYKRALELFAAKKSRMK